MTYKTTNGSEFELSQDCVLCNDVVFRDEYNPHHIRPWIIGNEYGPLVIVWASCEQDAFDIACDAGKLDGLSVDEEHYLELRNEACVEAQCHELQCPWKEDASACSCDHTCDTPNEIMLLGNASEPFSSEHAWIAEVVLTPRQERDFAEARGANVETLNEI